MMYTEYELPGVPGVRELINTNLGHDFLVVRIVLNNHKPTHSTTAPDLSEFPDFQSILLTLPSCNFANTEPILIFRPAFFSP